MVRSPANAFADTHVWLTGTKDRCAFMSADQHLPSATAAHWTQVDQRPAVEQVLHFPTRTYSGLRRTSRSSCPGRGVSHSEMPSSRLGTLTPCILLFRVPFCSMPHAFRATLMNGALSWGTFGPWLLKHQHPPDVLDAGSSTLWCVTHTSACQLLLPVLYVLLHANHHSCSTLITKYCARCH